jgi:hypothetical protein
MRDKGDFHFRTVQLAEHPLPAEKLVALVGVVPPMLVFGSKEGEGEVIPEVEVPKETEEFFLKKELEEVLIISVRTSLLR